MDNSRICSVADCGKQISSRRLCSAHYSKFLKYGDPLVKRQVEKGSHERWLRANIGYDGHDCLIWPFSSRSNGYGVASLQSKGLMAAHRFMCILVNGEPPTPKHVSAHSCNNGNKGCVSPLHVRWATHVENSADRYAHGTMMIGDKNPNTKLTKNQALEIYASSEKVDEIAKRYNVTVGCVAGIKKGANWAWLTGHKRYYRSRSVLASSQAHEAMNVKQAHLFWLLCRRV